MSILTSYKPLDTPILLNKIKRILLKKKKKKKDTHHVFILVTFLTSK